MSEIPNVRKIQGILEYVIKQNRSLLIVAPVSQQVKSALLMNKVKGNIKVNIIDLPGFGPTKKDTCEDLAILTGATVLNEELGDDLDSMTVEMLGEAEYSATDDKTTVLTIDTDVEELEERIDQVNKLIADEKNGFFKKKLEQDCLCYRVQLALLKSVLILKSSSKKRRIGLKIRSTQQKLL